MDSPAEDHRPPEHLASGPITAHGGSIPLRCAIRILTIRLHPRIRMNEFIHSYASYRYVDTVLYSRGNLNTVYRYRSDTGSTSTSTSSRISYMYSCCTVPVRVHDVQFVYCILVQYSSMSTRYKYSYSCTAVCTKTLMDFC